MRKWQYRKDHISGTDFLDPMMRKFNDLGQEGWEVFHVHEAWVNGLPSVLILSKRPDEGNDIPPNQNW